MSRDGIFETIDAISQGQPVPEGAPYLPWMVNRHFSYFADSILHAQEMNKSADLTPEQQATYYINTLKHRKRFTRWYKPEVPEHLNLIADHFGVNLRRAAEIVRLLDPELVAEYARKMKALGDGGRTARGEAGET